MSPYKFSFFLLFTLLFSCQEKADQFFTKLSPHKTGINFKNLLQESPQFNVLNYGYFYKGGGVAAGDLNNDGLTDLYFTGNMMASHLYLNKGNLKFANIAQKAGVEAAGLWNTGVTMADVNGDGWLDIYVCRSAAKAMDARRNLLFINNQDLTFTESATQYGIDDAGYSTQAAFFDYDRDGDLDLYVLNHSIQEYAGFGKQLRSLKKKQNPIYGDRVYRNDGEKFTEVSSESGIISNVLGFGLGIAIDDLNDDGWLDIYVSNDYNEQDYLYINQEDGTFQESLADFIDHTSLFSMGCDIADINNDGLPEIYTLDMLPESLERQKMTSGADNYNKKQSLVEQGFYHQEIRNMLHLNNGDGSFSEIGQLAGVYGTDWSWAALFADYDLDGYKDLFVTNGYKRDYTNMDFMSYAADLQIKSQQNNASNEQIVQDLIANMPSILEPNYLFQNQGDLTFKNKAAEWGLGEKSLSNGAIYADLDNDGDLDLVVNEVNEAASIYRNNAREFTDNNYLKIKLIGKDKNTAAIGAKVTLIIEDQKITQTLLPTRGYQSSVEPLLLFGLNKNTNIPKVEIVWPDGSTQSLENTAANQTLEVSHSPNPLATPPSPTPLFQIAKNSFGFQHQENSFNEFNQQALTPFMLSTQGPKMSKGDVDGDGLEDVFIGGAKGQIGGLFLQKIDGSFIRKKFNALQDDRNSEDIGSLFFDADGDGDLDLYVSSGSSEFEWKNLALQDRLYLNDGRGNLYKAKDHLPEMLSSTSCVSAADYDQDGDTDLFVGGRSQVGEYPKTPNSYLLQNDGNGKFTDRTEQLAPELLEIGMVTAAIWKDVDGDEQEDLILAGDWMPITIFQNKDSRIIKSPNHQIANTNGLWRSLTAADMDKDGDLDFIAGNFGQNNQFLQTDNQRLRLFYDDFDNNGTLDPILARQVGHEAYPFLYKDDLTQQLPSLKKSFLQYDTYAKANMADIFGESNLANIQTLDVNNLSSIYLENKGDFEFEVHPLPTLAQIAPIYAIEILDANEDGHLDVLLGGNFTENRVQFGRIDASKGLLLQGDGKGNFEAVPNTISGIQIRGSVRDFEQIKDQNDKTKILVARNNAGLMLLEKQ